MGKNNLAVNQLLERKPVFADLVNGCLFHGKQFLHQDNLELKSVHSGVMQQKKKSKIAALERYGDIRMEADMGTYSVIIAEETQDSVDYAMVVRNMLYDALEYTKQIKEIEKTHEEAEQSIRKKEFLSGLRKEDKLKPVITLVLYCGDEWDASECLYDLMDIDRDSESTKYIKEYIPDYKIHLIRPEKIPDMKVFHSCLQHIFSMVKFIRKVSDSEQTKRAVLS